MPDRVELMLAGAGGDPDKVSTTYPLPVAVQSGSITASITSTAKAVAVPFTRPANQTPYTALDVVGAAAAALTFTNIGAAGEWVINTTELRLDIASVPAGMTSFTLHLYNVTPPSALADNAVMTLTGDAAAYLGRISLGTPVDYGPFLYCDAVGVNKQISLLGANLYAYLQTTGGYTPAANSEVYTITLHATQAK